MDYAKKLLKSSDNKKISGVCAGIAKYFGVDATIVRLIFALCMLFFGFGLAIYLVCLVLMPSEPEQIITQQRYDN